MSEVDLYNLSPLAQLLLLGGLVAAPPLLWVRWKGRGQTTAGKLRILATVTLFLTFDLVLFGAFTRLTDSGLGCPDWPGCYGHASPIGASGAIAQAQAILPDGPVTHTKAWIEMLHRYLASGVGALILVATVWAWRARRETGVHPVWPTLTLAWVCLQGAFGAWTVTMKLFPAIVTLHLMGGMVLLGLLRWQSLQGLGDSADATSSGVSAASSLPWRPWAAALLVVAGVQVALGGWVSTNYAVMACTDFPKCQGSWWPDMDFVHGFELWRQLGETAAGEALPFHALTAIHYTHRLAAYGVLAAMLALALLLRRWPQTRGAAWALLGLALWQLLTGLSNVVLGWPLLGAVAHTGGAAALVVVLVGLMHPSSAAQRARVGGAREGLAPAVQEKLA